MVAMLKDENLSRSTGQGGTVSLELSLKPEELFPSYDTRYIDVASTNSHVLALCETPAGPGFLLFNEANKPEKIPEGLFPSAAITAGDVLKAAGGSAISLKGEKVGKPFPEITAVMGLTETEAANVKRELLPLAGENGVVLAEKLAALGNKQISTKDFDLCSDSNERYICLIHGTSGTFYRAVDENLRPLSPDKWRALEIKDLTKIPQDMLDQYPVLQEFVCTDKGTPVPDLPFAVSLTNGVLTVVDTTQGIRAFSEGASCYAMDPNNRGQLYFVDSKGLLRIADLTQMSGKAMAIQACPFPVDGTVSSLRFDPHGNFLMATAENAGSRSMYFIEKDTRKIAARLDDVGLDYDVNRYGELYFIDGKSRLRAADTGVNKFSREGLEEARAHERRKLSHLVTSAQAVVLPEIPIETQVTAADAEAQPDKNEELRVQMMEQAMASVNARLMPEVDKVGTVQALDALSSRIEVLKQTNGFREYPQVFSDVEKRIAEKIDTLETERLVEEMDAFKTELRNRHDVTHLTMLHESWGSIDRLRRSLVISNSGVRDAVDGEFNEVKAKAQGLIEALEKETKEQLEDRYASVEKLVRDTEYMRDFQTLRAAPEVIQFETLVASLSDSDERKAWRSKYRELYRTQEEELLTRQGSAQQQQMMRVAETLEDANEVLSDIKGQLQEILAASEMVRWRHKNPLVLRYRSIIMALPEDIRETSMQELDKVLEQRNRELVQIEGASIQRSTDKVKFKDEEFDVFPETRLIWRPCVKTMPGVDDLGRLVFRDTAGREYVPDCQPVPFDMECKETKDQIEYHRPDAEDYFESLKAPIPEWNKTWVLNPWVLGNLDMIAEACREQLTLGSGIVILEGEGGCGKDVYWKMFSNLTRRGLEEIPFNIQTAKEDLTYEYQFIEKIGTVKVPSKLTQAAQVPGTVVVLGEINTAPPGVLKMLNPAMDDSRRIGDKPMERTVLLAGTMNPQYYLGTQKISPEVRSRATIIQIGYPPIMNADGSKYLPYEAEMAAKHIPELADVPQKEFYAMWDAVANQDPTSDGERYLNAPKKELVNHLLRLVVTANRIREQYSAYHRNETYAEEADFPFSLRETIQIAARLTPGSKVGDLIKRIVLPKIPEPNERMRVEAIIDDPFAENAQATA